MDTKSNNLLITSWEIISVDSTAYEVYDDKVFIIIEGIGTPGSSLITKLKSNELLLTVNDSLYENSNIYYNDLLDKEKSAPLELDTFRIKSSEFMFKYHVNFKRKTAMNASMLYDLYSAHFAANLSVLSVQNGFEINKAPELGLRIFVNGQEMSLDSVQEMYYSPL